MPISGLLRGCRLVGGYPAPAVPAARGRFRARLGGCCATRRRAGPLAFPVEDGVTWPRRWRWPSPWPAGC
jgi:hypothetical protein